MVVDELGCRGWLAGCAGGNLPLTAGAGDCDRYRWKQTVLSHNHSTQIALRHTVSRVQVSLHAGGALQQELTVVNTGERPMEFTAALHTYFTVSGEKLVAAPDGQLVHGDG